MSLTPEDLRLIRQIMREEIASVDGRLVAVENDVKAIYFMIKKLQVKA